MQAYWTLARRELSGYFLSMTGYVVIAAAMLLMGYSFVVMLHQLQQQPTPMPVTELFYVTWYFWLVLLLTTPVITMRLFALEKFSGTFETLLTAPVSDRQVVLAKFSAAMAFYMVVWLPLSGCMLLVHHYANDPTALDWGILGATLLGIMLVGGVFVSLGCLASALTRSQALAAMLTAAFGASVFLLALLADQVQAPVQWQAQLLSTLALFQYMHDFCRGVVDTRPVVLLLSATLFFLFLTLRVVESRRWK
jgi:ABC-2 type transport system permease protein